MKTKVTRFVLSIVFLFGIINTGELFAQDESLPRLEIQPDEVELAIGDSIELQALYVDTSEAETDTTVQWDVSPDSLGTFTSAGMFTAQAVGQGFIYATLDTLTDSVEVEVEMNNGNPDEPGEGEGGGPVVVMPSDTIAEVGSTIQFQAYFQTPDTLLDTTATWSLEGMPIGTLSSDGQLVLDSVGFALVYAQVGSYSGSALLVSTDSSADTTGVTNSIVITRDSRNPRGYAVMDSLEEGGIWTVGGLRYPMNILNGGGVYFPHGSLSEDIRIHISLPQFADTSSGDSVSFGPPAVVTGVDFQVMVNDTISEPYYFETPLFVGLPFKRGLIRHLGLDPASLGLYFAIVDGDTVTFDSTGIEYTAVDSSRNRIFSSVAHFSSLVVKGNTSTTGTKNTDARVPAGYALSQNYPNPFNPVTQISYTLPKSTEVSLTVYNSLGQEVTTLVNKQQQSGTYHVTWQGLNSRNQQVASGIYFYRLDAGDYSMMKKMVLIR